MSIMPERFSSTSGPKITSPVVDFPVKLGGPNMVDCEHCGGSGKVKEPCPLCHDTGRIHKSVSGNNYGGSWSEPCPRGCRTPIVMFSDMVTS